MTLPSLAILVMCGAPSLLLLSLSTSALFARPLDERTVGTLTTVTFASAFLAAVTALVNHVLTASRGVQSLGTWFSSEHAGFSFDFVIDGQSLGFATLALGMCGVVAAFSFRYLHREPGFNRYFIQLALFTLGITLVAVAGSVEMLFAGWEMIGLSSALLVGFFHERPQAVRNAFRVFVVYRVSDAAMLSAAVLLHHWSGSGSLLAVVTQTDHARALLSDGQALVISALLIVAVAAKSALLPFSGWLPRAMEGPTPSSAVYYGALSIHAGCFLLLRVEPLLAQSPVAQLLAGVLGLATALVATAVARVQSDIKSALAFASLSQVGIIVVEISAGLTTLAFVHIIGHACFRLLQFLSAPNLLHDLHDIENRSGHHGLKRSTWPRFAPGQRWFLFALERAFVDSLLDRVATAPFSRLVSHLDSFDRALCGQRRAAKADDTKAVR